MSGSIFLHIGMPKTGTTSIQAFLHENRQKLRNCSLVVPTAAGQKNHSGLTLYALNDDNKDTLRRAHGLVTVPAVRRFRETLEEKLGKEAVNWKQEDTIVLTNEHMSLLREAEEFQRLKKLLAVGGDRQIRVVIYLRRQDLAYLSGYSQRIKNGAVVRWSELEERYDPTIWDYVSVLEGWRQAFGRENIIVRPFERSQMVGGDLIKDFLTAIGFGDFPIEGAVNKNESLDARSLEFLRRLNKWYPRFVDGRLNTHRRALVLAMEKLSTGPSIRMERESAIEFLKQYEECNRTVAREYLGRPDGKLFLDIPKDEAEQQPSLSIDEVIEISAKLWAAANKIDLAGEPDGKSAVGESPAKGKASQQKARRPKVGRTQEWNWF